MNWSTIHRQPLQHGPGGHDQPVRSKTIQMLARHEECGAAVLGRPSSNGSPPRSDSAGVRASKRLAGLARRPASETRLVNSPLSRSAVKSMKSAQRRWCRRSRLRQQPSPRPCIHPSGETERQIGAAARLPRPAYDRSAECPLGSGAATRCNTPNARRATVQGPPGIRRGVSGALSRGRRRRTAHRVVRRRIRAAR
jgi:hypothetical protein